MLQSYEFTSWSIVRRAKSGSAVDRDRFAQRYAPILRSYFAARWRLPEEHEDVQDACQDVFVDCFKAGGFLTRVDPQGSAPFRVFLAGVARRGALRFERDLRRRRNGCRVEFDQIEHEDDTPSVVFEQGWARMITVEACQLMRARAQECGQDLDRLKVLNLRYQEGLSVPEISDRFGMEPKQMYEVIRQGKCDFRAALLEVLVTYNPNATEREVKQECLDLLQRL